MLLHASENTVIGAVFLTQLGYLSVYGVYLVLAALIVIATRGQLSYQGFAPSLVRAHEHEHEHE
jgi:hypothetical protein